MLLALAVVATVGPPAAEGAPRYRVLVFTRTEGFHHASIPAAVTAMRAIGRSRGFSVTVTTRPGTFTDASLRRFRAVVFLLTSGDVLDPPQQAALQRYVEGGGGFVGVHSAANTETRWPFFGRLLGARFRGHPAVQAATAVVTDGAHPATRGLPHRHRWTDEWYAFRANPRPHVHVLLRVDEHTYRPGGSPWVSTTRSPGRSRSAPGARSSRRSATPPPRTARSPSAAIWAAASRGRPARRRRFSIQLILIRMSEILAPL